MIEPAADGLLRRQAVEWDGGRGPRLRTILERSPSLRGRPEEILDLVYQEILLREQAGETPVAADYRSLLPGLEEELNVLFALDKAVHPLTSPPAHADSMNPTGSVGHLSADRETPPSAPADFPRYLVQLGLISPADLRRCPEGASTADLLNDLAGRGLLTPYQVDRVRDGRAADLVLGGYAVTGVIGRGGMGQVFQGRHRELGRPAALKVIRPDFLAGTAVVRFHREARAVARLNHPNVVTLYEAVLTGPRPFLAMEFVRGRALVRVVEASGPLPPGEALEVIRQAALGLHHAHSRGLVHRDVKPGNVILADAPPSPAARVKVLDFGLVGLRETGDALTETGTALGTPDYMAPEQFSAGRLTDARADVYSLGCTLYYLLAGRPPFPGGTLWDKRDAHQKQSPGGIDGLPAGVAGLLGRMLAKRPADRPAGAGAVAEEAERLIAPDRPRPAPLLRASTTDTVAPAVTLPSGRRPRWRFRYQAGLAVILAVGVVVLTVRRPGNRPETAGAPAPFRQPDPVEPTGGLGRPAVPPPPPALGPLVDPARQVRNRIRFNQTSAKRAVFAPTGDVAVIAGLDGSPRPWDLRKGERPGPAEGEPNNPMWLGPFLTDGKSLVSGDDAGAVRRWAWPGLTSQTLPPLSASPESRIWALAIKPGGRELVTGQDGGWLRTWDLVGGREIDRHRPHRGDLLAVVISPDGGRALCGGRQGDEAVLFEYEFRTKTVTALEGHTGPVWGVAYSPDGRFAASVGADSALILWRLADARSVTREKLPEAAIGLSLALRPGGNVLATGDGNGYLRLWTLPDPWDASGGRIPLLHSFKGEGSLEHVAFDPSGDRLLSCDGTEVVLWDVPR
ncbi:MAG: serine/threonine protein kinase [Gemmataceae bacterium]|nr:serine/threonine protein kinase [Gemmataceae bacterium]